MRKVICSRCNGSGYNLDAEIQGKCPDCNGVGWFDHWNDGQDPVKMKHSLASCVIFLEMAKAELMDYVSGGREAHTRQDQKVEMDRLRWERDYWAHRCQLLRGELDLLKGVDDGGESIAAESEGIACGKGPPDGTGSGIRSLHEGRVADGDGGPAKGVDYRIP